MLHSVSVLVLHNSSFLVFFFRSAYVSFRSFHCLVGVRPSCVCRSSFFFRYSSSPCSSFVVRRSLFVVRCLLFVVFLSLFFFSLFVVRRSSFVVRCLSFVVVLSLFFFSLFVVRRSLFVARLSFIFICSSVSSLIF